MGPFFIEIGGSGIALTIFALTLTYLFNSEILIVDIKLITVWPVLNSRFGRIIFPTFGVTAKKIQSDLSIISWLLLEICIFLFFFFETIWDFYISFRYDYFAYF